MPEIALEIATCGSCGADVRDQSTFCYSCGEPVKQDLVENKPDVEESTDTLASTEGTATDVEESSAQAASPIERAATDVETESRPPLISAASLRKQRRAFSRRPVEVTWEKPTREPIGFFVMTIILAILALVSLILALYLR